MGSRWELHGNTNMPIYYTEYYCKRDNEKAASLIHISMNGISINKNGYFRYYAKRYFSDNSEIVAKIERKEYTYKNIVEMITYYKSK